MAIKMIRRTVFIRIEAEYPIGVKGRDKGMEGHGRTEWEKRRRQRRD